MATTSESLEVQSESDTNQGSIESNLMLNKIKMLIQSKLRQNDSELRINQMKVEAKVQ